MQLSSRILTALAVLILAVAVVAVRAGSPGTVEAATGTIDVVNVGTCYTTDEEVFGVSDCNDGDEDAYLVAGRDDIVEVGTVYATYAFDPTTAADDPRGILTNSDLIKISIQDSERDRRTPVLLATSAVDAAALDTFQLDDDLTTADVLDDEVVSDDLAVVRKDFEGIKPDNRTFRWQRRGAEGDFAFDSTGGVFISGITITKGNAEDDYRPMFVVEGDDSPISLYGTVAGLTDTTKNGFQKINNYLAIDEDVGSGRVDDETGNSEAEVAPWFSVKASIDVGATVTLQYVVYLTSERETLIGGESVGDYKATVNAPDFTTSEKNATSATITLEARSDGGQGLGNVNLWMRETSRFSGRYEGFLRLTDENGDGGNPATNWGLDVQHATGHGDSDAEVAVVGIESGPVVIAYKDTDGSNVLHSIEIDTVAPAVQIDSPAQDSQIQDTSPEFAGSYTDDDSGLREDSFRLYIDHTNDIMENGIAGNVALDLRVDGTTDSADNRYGLVEVKSPATVIESTNDYGGFAAPSRFGVIGHADVFNVPAQAGDRPTTPAAEREYQTVEGDDHDDGAFTGSFGDSARISFDPNTKTGDYNNTIDFQALVADRAGNIGFSDSDDEGPRFINDYGEKTDDRNTERYNVLGWFARHYFVLDETDPAIFDEQSVTGFYGEDDDDEPQVSRRGILIAFDRAIDEDSIDLDTFTVTLDAAGNESVAVTDFDTEGRAVYLLLENELASDARPYVDVGSGKWVEDPAGNRLTGGDVAPFAVRDGIVPKIEVILSGGSGTGEGDEGPDKLTKETITVTINADEEIYTTPSLVIVCSDIGWDGDDDNTELDQDLDDLVASRSGGIKGQASANFEDPATYDCGYDYLVGTQPAQSYSRPGLSWEYQWLNFGDSKSAQDGNEALQDGKLTVLAYARDRQAFASLNHKDFEDRLIEGDALSDDTNNWGAGTAEFRYDTTLNPPMATPDGSEPVTESRPFVVAGLQRQINGIHR